jgi:hypothetical protein
LSSKSRNNGFPAISVGKSCSYSRKNWAGSNFKPFWQECFFRVKASLITNILSKGLTRIGPPVQKLQQLMPFFIGNNTVWGVRNQRIDPPYSTWCVLKENWKLLIILWPKTSWIQPWSNRLTSSFTERIKKILIPPN